MKKYNFNENWSFYKDGKEPVMVNLPHDAMLLEKRNPVMPDGSASGYYPGGKYYYVNHLSGEFFGKGVILEFEGIYRNSKVFLNGELIGGHCYGYTNFYVDLTGKLTHNENVIKVEVDNSQFPNARWYTGSGIFRNVNLYIGDKNYFKPQGIKIKTLSIDPAVISVECNIFNKENCQVLAQVKTGKRIVATAEGENFEIKIPKAKLWAAETPHLYNLSVYLIKDGEVVDEETIQFGIRLVKCDSINGFQINGKQIKLKGGCIHHDNGIVGARSYVKAEYRKIRKLKEMGYNAIRSSHYPAGKDLLDVCDKLGMYVLDEAFDVWKIPKNTYDYASDFETEWKKDIDAMVEKDYNHPSVIMYSVGNEITDMGFPFGGAICKMLCDEIRTLDATRPITCGINVIIVYLAQKMEQIKKDKEKYLGSQEFNSLAAIQERLNKIAEAITAEEIESSLGTVFSSVDIIGFNYGERFIEKLHELKPDYVFLSTETYPKHIYENWQRVKKLPYLIGDFMWTAWDYLGESGVGLPMYGDIETNFVKEYPCLTAACGSFDLIGNPEPQAYYTATVWGRKEPYIAVRPVNHSGEKCYIGEWRLTDAVNSWDWKGYEGKLAEITVYNRGDCVELYKNGVLMETKTTKEYMAKFETEYQDGELKAIIYKNGESIFETKIMTPSDTVVINAYPEETAVGSREILFVNICLEDENGNTVFNNDKEIKIKVKNGTLLAFGSADPCAEKPYRKSSQKTYHGKLLAVIIADKGKLGITLSSEGLETKRIQLPIK